MEVFSKPTCQGGRAYKVGCQNIVDIVYLYGMPILFPVNRIENGIFDFEGRHYVFPIVAKNIKHSFPFTEHSALRKLRWGTAVFF